MTIKNQKPLMNARFYRAQRLIRLGELLEHYGPMLSLVYTELDAAHDEALEAEQGSEWTLEVFTIRVGAAVAALQRMTSVFNSHHNHNFGVTLGDDLTLQGMTPWCDNEIVAANTYRPEEKS